MLFGVNVTTANLIEACANDCCLDKARHVDEIGMFLSSVPIKIGEKRERIGGEGEEDSGWVVMGPLFSLVD